MKTESIEIGMKEKNIEKIIAMLNKVLADEFMLFTKLNNYHWNVKGKNFYSLHNLFEEQYDKVHGIIDDVAERIRARGGLSRGSMEEFRKLSRLKDVPTKKISQEKMLRNLIGDNELVVSHLRTDIELCEEYNDLGTQDLLIRVAQEHEDMAWMLRSSL